MAEGFSRVHFRQRRIGAMLLPACFLTLFALWVGSPWGIALEQRLGLEMLFQWRGERAPPPQVVVLAITRECAQTLGAPDKLHQWSRHIHAQAVTQLRQLGARLVVFDIFFEQARDAAGDLAFAAAIKQADNVLLFARAERQRITLGDDDFAEQESIVPPLAILNDAALAVAPLILPKIPARVDRFFIRHPGLPQQLTLQALALQTIAPNTPHPHGDALLYNFYGPPRTVTTIDFARLLQHPDAVKSQIENAVVFVGYSATYQHDQRDGFYTAFTADSGLDISGVELAATAFANLQDDSWLREAPPWVNVLWILSYGVLLLVLARQLTPVTAAAAQLLAAAIASALMYLLFVRFQLWLPWFQGVLVLTPLAGGISMWKRSRELYQQKARLQQAFGKYLPEEEVHRLVMQSDLPASQEHHHSICMVTDAQGYSRLSEQLSAVELSQLMQDYYSAVIGAIRAGRGLISDVTGDGIIALWPHLEPKQAWPILQPVVVAIQSAVQQFNARHPQHTLPTRIGVHAGEIVLGHFGALDHYEFRAMGDIVNTTARLEGVNKQIGTQVLLSEACLDGHSNLQRDQLRYLGRFKFVGKAEPLRLYTPVASDSPALVQEFTAALSLFEHGQAQVAADRFHALAARFPNDGPSRFYAEFLLQPRLREQEQQDQQDFLAGIVTLHQK